MRVVIAGATGVLGRRLVAQFSSRGTVVIGFARTDVGEATIRSLGGRPIRVDLFDTNALVRAMDGADVVIHAATAIPQGLNARFGGAWKQNDRIRRDGTRALASAAAAAGVRQYLQQSVAWMVKSAPPGEAYDEETAPHPPVLVKSALDGENIAREIGHRHGLRVGVLRGGVFYGPEASLPMVTLMQKRFLPIPGNGADLKAPIHVEDMARAFVAAADAGVEGVWHVVDDEPVPLASLFRYLAAATGAPEPRSIPEWSARLLLGGDVVESLTTSMNTSNAKIRRELGWTPSFPTYRAGIADTVAIWRQAGVLRSPTVLP